MSGIGDLLGIVERFNKAGMKGKIGYIILAMGVVAIIATELISRLQPVIDFNTKYNITQRIVSTMNTPVMTMEFAAIVILGVLVTIVLTAIVVVIIIGIEEKRVYDARSNAANKIKAHNDVMFNVTTALDKLSKFPYEDGTAIGREGTYVATVSAVKKGVPSPQKLDEIIGRVKGKDANIAELLERAKKSIVDNDLYKP